MPDYRVVVVDKPRQEGTGVWWIWRIVNRFGHIMASGHGLYWSEYAARKASKRVLENLRWGTK
jgi:hypothetical protein